MKLLPEILVISTYPPRECGIATYTHDLIQAIHEKYRSNFDILVCALETSLISQTYPTDPHLRLVTDESTSYAALAKHLHEADNIKLVLIQHEFGLFDAQKFELEKLLKAIPQPIIIAFHTVLMRPDHAFQDLVISYAEHAQALIVMTHASSLILQHDYAIPEEQIHVIPHGTHLLEHANKDELKVTYKLKGKKVLSTFGFIGKNKSIETTLYALPEIIKQFPTVIFLIIGKTHPNTIANEGETYRSYLEQIVQQKGLEKHVRWINYFLPIAELLDYLTLTDIYLFTSNDPNQAVSGTFSYAISSGCPVISTRIPHVTEVLKEDMGVIIDFNDSGQLADAVVDLLENTPKRTQMRTNSLQGMANSAWENSAIQHVNLFQQVCPNRFQFELKWPAFNLLHVNRMTSDVGMIQFSKINEPDPDSGYTLDDNARALIVMCEQYTLEGNSKDLKLVRIYLDFIEFCQQANGSFLNYVSIDQNFTAQNEACNLEDSIGRTIWALGFVISKQNNIPESCVLQAKALLQKSLPNLTGIHSTRAMAFIIKGLYLANIPSNLALIDVLAQRLAGMYAHESKENWQWFEHSLTYANSLLSEAMLLAGLATGNRLYHKIAVESFEFLLTHIFDKNGIHVISNEFWDIEKARSYGSDTPMLSKIGGEQAIDVSYTILALAAFHQVYFDESYEQKMRLAFDWFLGKNHLNQIVYNPCTGGCYDGLEKENVNLNQGAESTVSYLMARQAMEKIKQPMLHISVNRMHIS
jgi:glycosyltransferase involved in cell wall biosynthesis